MAGSKLFHHAQHLQYANAFGQAGFVPVDARTGQAASSTLGREKPDTDARWGGKRDTFWLGYKLHVTETCDDEPRCGCPGDGGTGRRGHDQDCAAPAFPNLITHVATTDAAVTDNQITAVIDDELAGKTLARAGTTSIPATSAPPWWSRR